MNVCSGKLDIAQNMGKHETIGQQALSSTRRCLSDRAFWLMHLIAAKLPAVVIAYSG
jgi:hypothetical protein